MKNGICVTSILTLICLLCLPLCAQEEPTWSGFAIGNEYQAGGGVMLQPGDFTAFGFDGRWYDQEDDVWSASGVVLWKAIPTVTLPVGGLFPQLGLPVPETIEVGINLGGRLGYERNETAETDNAIAALLIEAELNPGKRASLAVRYEYAFDQDVWGELPTEPKQHMAFLVLRYRF